MGARPSPERRLLAVSAVPPWPMVDGYSLRAGHFLEELSRDRTVTLVSPPPDSPSASSGLPEDIEWLRVEGVPATSALPWREERALLAQTVRSLLRERHFSSSLLWNGTEYLAAEIDGFPSAVADRIDCESLQAWRGRKHRERWRQKLRQFRQGLELAIYERKVLRPLAGLVVTGADDARALRFITGRRDVEVVPNGVALPRLDDLPGEDETPTVIFTGVLSYGPNIEAARHFALEVWPGIHRRRPDARFVIAGRAPVAAVQALEGEPGVIVRADVPDLTAEIRTAWVAVAPMRSGSGIKNKVLEGWAAARPVVLTELATNGLALDRGASPLASLVCRDRGEMASTVLELLEDPSRRERLGREARVLAEERHSWEAAGRSLSRHLSDALSIATGSGAREAV